MQHFLLLKRDFACLHSRHSKSKTLKLDGKGQSYSTQRMVIWIILKRHGVVATAPAVRFRVCFRSDLIVASVISAALLAGELSQKASIAMDSLGAPSTRWQGSKRGVRGTLPALDVQESRKALDTSSAAFTNLLGEQALVNLLLCSGTNTRPSARCTGRRPAG